ncbi:telomerase reverse transcriptase isoform X2 [Stigmatopora argus]
MTTHISFLAIGLAFSKTSSDWTMIFFHGRSHPRVLRTPPKLQETSGAIMSTAESTPVLDIIRSLYHHAYSLEEFTDRLLYREGHKVVLVEQGDSERFKSFVKSVFVGCDKELEQHPSDHHMCTFSELLAFILNNLKRKKKRNVLIHGYHLQPEKRDADQFKFQGDLTQSAASIHGSDQWKKVALRLGSDITRHLLETCSIFVTVPPSCALQLSGVPLYDKVSKSAGPSGFGLQNPTGGRRHVKSLKSKRALSSRSKNFRVLHGKRKRETHREEYDAPVPGKRRRLEELRKVLETPQEGPPVSPRSVEVKTLVAKQPSEPSTPILKSQPSWRSGISPTLPPFVSTMAFLYGGRGMNGFILNRKKRCGAGSKRLQGQDVVRLVFLEGMAHLNVLERKARKLPRRFFNMVPLFSQFLRQHRHYAYRKTLCRLCPLTKSDLSGDQLGSLLRQHCTAHRVYLFVRQCLCDVVPVEFWGSAGNRCLFLARVRAFVRSGKFDKFSSAELMWKMKVNDCNWLKISKKGGVPPSELAYRTRLLGQMLTWLLAGYVSGLVRSCFYVTESVGLKHALRFYRQEVWTRLQELAFSNHVAKGQMEELSPEQVGALPKSTVIARLRFIPKMESMRPITRVLGTDAKTRAFQRSVRDLRDVLRACVSAMPTLLGCTVWGVTDIHEILTPLAQAQKEKSQPLYFAKVDVSGAYESLPHDKLLHVMEHAMSSVMNESFTVRCYAKIWADSFEGLQRSFLRQANFAESELGTSNMKGFVSALGKNSNVHHAILVEQQFSSDVHGKDLLQFFTHMLTETVVKFGEKTYRQRRGIPQGSVASNLLCYLNYGHMENALFKGITGGKGRLMRLVDDFLLITPDLREAQKFLKILLAGVPEYGLVINPQKVAVNFSEYEIPIPCDGVRKYATHCLFPWCGLLLDTYSLDVYKDYRSYAGLSLRHSLTFAALHSAGEQMRRKLMRIIRLKCNVVLLDLKTNSVRAVYKNIYELVLLHGFRFHVCAQSLPFGQTVAKNPLNFLRMIRDMAQYTNELLRRCNKGFRPLACIVPPKAVDLLFCLSFVLVLSRYRSHYKGLLPYLHKWKRSLEHCLEDLQLARVRQAASPKTPAAFSAIQIYQRKPFLNVLYLL